MVVAAGTERGARRARWLDVTSVFLGVALAGLSFAPLLRTSVRYLAAAGHRNNCSAWQGCPGDTTSGPADFASLLPWCIAATVLVAVLAPGVRLARGDRHRPVGVRLQITAALLVAVTTVAVLALSVWQPRWVGLDESNRQFEMIPTPGLWAVAATAALIAGVAVLTARRSRSDQWSVLVQAPVRGLTNCQ